MVRELRKQALESHKKPSRKSQKAAQEASLTASPAGTPAGSRLGSRLNSPAMSRMGSRIGSRDATDAEDSSEEGSLLSDDLSFTEEKMSLDEAAMWESMLKDRIQDIIERKGSSTQSREQALASYARVLTQRYAEEEISGKEQDLIISFLKSIKQESSEEEVELALRALELTAITSGRDTLFEDCAPRLKRTINDSTSEQVKALAIRSYAILAFFSGAEDEAMIEMLEFVVEIIETDGVSIDCEPSSAVAPVQAAIEAYSFMITQIEDLSDYSSEHVEILSEQLDSSDVSVQLAAGQAIALLFEKSYTPPEDDDDVNTSDPKAIVRSSEAEGGRPVLIRRYDATISYNEVVSKIERLASTVGRAKRKDIKTSRQSFRYILSSIENPSHGPMYSQAINEETDQAYGSRLKIKFGKTGVMHVNKWWKYARVHMLRACLRSGFMMHYEQNPLVFEVLPVIMMK